MSVNEMGGVVVRVRLKLMRGELPTGGLTPDCNFNEQFHCKMDGAAVVLQKGWRTSGRRSRWCFKKLELWRFWA